jgi:hypothetical protein
MFEYRSFRHDNVQIFKTSQNNFLHLYEESIEDNIVPNMH